MGRRKRVLKEYRLNVDTIDYNDRQIFDSGGLEMEAEYFRENPKALRRKGTSIGGLDAELDNRNYSKKK